MQFDDELENDNNEFSLDDDTSAISWQDLLSSDDDLDIDDNAKKEDEVQKTSSIADFDITQLQEDVVADENAKAEEAKEESLILNSEDEISFDEPEQLLLEDNTKETSEVADAENNSAKENVSDNNDSKYEQNVNAELNNSEYISPETELLDEANDENISLNADEVSAVLDDELLSILNENDDSEAGKQSEDAAPIQNDVYAGESENTEEIIANDVPVDDGADFLSYNEDFASEAQASVDSEDKNEEDIVPNKENKSLVPVLVIVLLLLFVAGGGYMGYMYISNSVSSDVDIENPAVTIGGDDAIEADVPVALKKDDADKELQKPKKSEKRKAAKEEKEEAKTDKVVVQVPVGGRRNPFVPSSMFNGSEFGSYGINLTMPPEIDPDDPQAVEARKLFSISVSGIMYDPAKPSAILKFDNKDYFVQKGDRIDTYTVHLITKEYVAIRNQANIYKAYVGESFTLEPVNIPASQQMKIKNGQRQYISSDDVGIKVK